MMERVNIKFYNNDNYNWTVSLMCAERGTKSNNNNSVNNVIKKYLVELDNITDNEDIDVTDIKCAIIEWNDGYISECEIAYYGIMGNFGIREKDIYVYVKFTIKKEQFVEWHNKYGAKNIILK